MTKHAGERLFDQSKLLLQLHTTVAYFSKNGSHLSHFFTRRTLAVASRTDNKVRNFATSLPVERKRILLCAI